MTEDEATENLRRAIIDHAIAHGMHDPDDQEILNHWGIVAHWQAVVDDGSSRYTTHFHQPSVPPHIAQGLFRAGEGFAAGRPVRDDEE